MAHDLTPTAAIDIDADADIDGLDSPWGDDPTAAQNTEWSRISAEFTNARLAPPI
jgi:hypothetical protein